MLVSERTLRASPLRRVSKPERLRGERDGRDGSDPRARLERRLAIFLRALWGRSFDVRVLAKDPRSAVAAVGRPSIAGGRIALPVSASEPGAERLAFAAAAHASAHLVFSPTQFHVEKLKPIQIVLVSLLEDARVEALAMERFPGLFRLWVPFHTASAGGYETVASLLARLSRALLEPKYDDDHFWIDKCRTAFFADRGAWSDPDFTRTLASRLGNDLGQMRLGFDARTYVVEPAYRDDYRALWDLPTEAPAVTQSATGEGMRPDDGDGAIDRRRDAAEALPEDGTESVAVSLAESDAGSAVALLHPEWDYHIRDERPEWCTVYEVPPDRGDPTDVATSLTRHRTAATRVRALVRSIRFETALRGRPSHDGDDLSFDRAVEALVDLRSGVPPNGRVYTRPKKRERRVSVLLLLDLSESTNDVVGNASQRLIHVARDAAALLADGLVNTPDHFAIHGFSSNGRSDVRYRRIKDFSAAYDDACRARLAGVRGELSTRMGAALRHARRHLELERADKKLLLVLTDGEPHDVDVADPAYLVHDAKAAVRSNERARIVTYCMSLDPRADAYAARIFGNHRYAVVDHVERLPEKLPLIYRALTRV
jgi:hypothetical protein